MYMYIKFLYPFIHKRALRLFHNLVIMNYSTMNMGVQIASHEDIHIFNQKLEKVMPPDLFLLCKTALNIWGSFLVSCLISDCCFYI
jgi:hypothetical protein